VRPAHTASLSASPASVTLSARFYAHVLDSRKQIGVVACITPFNFPMTNCAGKMGAALACGNTVVVKPAPADPLGVAALCRIVAGVLPPGVLNFVGGQGPEIGEALVLAPEVDMISFTGSSAVGARIREAVAPRMTRVLLELGGKSPNIVFADADPAAALACGGKRPPHLARGYYVEPTLFTGVRNDMVIAREEIFGPVISAIPFRDEAEAIALANDSDYGLYGYLWTRDPERALRVARAL